MFSLLLWADYWCRGDRTDGYCHRYDRAVGDICLSSRCGGVDCDPADYGRHSIACNWCVLRMDFAPQRRLVGFDCVAADPVSECVVKFVRQLFWSVFESFVSVLSANGWGIVVIVLLFLANLFGLRMAAKVQVALVLALASALCCTLGLLCKSANRVVVAVVARRGRWFCDGGVLA